MIQSCVQGILCIVCVSFAFVFLCAFLRSAQIPKYCGILLTFSNCAATEQNNWLCFCFIFFLLFSSFNFISIVRSNRLGWLSLIIIYRAECCVPCGCFLYYYIFSAVCLPRKRKQINKQTEKRFCTWFRLWFPMWKWICFNFGAFSFPTNQQNKQTIE